AKTIVWAAGVQASPAARWLGAASDRAGRVVVGPDLTVAGRPEVFAIGDTASCTMADGKPVPGIAPAAKQQGKYVANLIGRRLKGKPADGPFKYRHQGNLATIGRSLA
ncbi:FAD-dependent oxidoreductase, partial [Pseudomonas aeruginosa]